MSLKLRSARLTSNEIEIEREREREMLNTNNIIYLLLVLTYKLSSIR